MSSLKWLGIWGMVNHSPPTAAEKSKWSKGMKDVLDDPNGRYHFKQYVTQMNITLPEGKCTHFRNFTIRQITCNFK